MGCFVYNTIGVSLTDPKLQFESYGLPHRILGHFADDQEFVWQMYWSLPAEITDRVKGVSRNQYKIPQPNAVYNHPGDPNDTSVADNPVAPDAYKRSALNIARTCAAEGRAREALAANHNWRLGGTDNVIWDDNER